MQETIEQLKILFRNFWEHKWLALMTTILFSVIGWTAVVMAPDRYEVTTRVYVDSRSMLRPLLKGLAVDSSVTESTAEIMKRILLARQNLEKIAKKSELDANIETPEAYERMIKILSEKIMITGGREMDNIYTITYTHRDPVMAKKVVQAFLDMFIEKVTGANRLDTNVTKKFLDEKIADYEVRLAKAEERLKEFKKQYPGVVGTDDKTYFTRLEEMKKQLQSARLELQEQQHRRAALAQQLKTTPRYTGTGLGSRGGSVGQTPIDLKIQEAQAEIEGLLLKYSDQHPDVKAAKRRLIQLKAQKAAGVTGAEGKKDTNAGVAPIALANPSYQTLKLAYSEADAMVAALETRVQEYKKQLAELEANADTLPDIEAKLASLNRDYQVNKREYEELLKRRSAADISEGVNNADELQFEIIEPPRVPLAPVGPNRIKWITVVFLMALGVGAGLAILLSMMNPKIYDKQSVKNLTTLPVLGTVSHLGGVGIHLKKGMGNITYSITAGILLLVYAALVMAYLFDVGIVQDLAGFDVKRVEEQLGDGVLDPIKDALEEI